MHCVRTVIKHSFPDSLVPSFGSKRIWMSHVLFLSADNCCLKSRFITSKNHQNILSEGFMPKFSSVVYAVLMEFEICQKRGLAKSLIIQDLLDFNHHLRLYIEKYEICMFGHSMFMYHTIFLSAFPLVFSVLLVFSPYLWSCGGIA